jgi:hypothetical protein
VEKGQKISKTVYSKKSPNKQKSAQTGHPAEDDEYQSCKQARLKPESNKSKGQTHRYLSQPRWGTTQNVWGKYLRILYGSCAYMKCIL